MREVSITPAQLAVLRERLDNLGPVLQIIGKIIKDYANNAFINQRFGDEVWPEVHVRVRNIIATPSGFQRGPFLRPTQWRRRPALIETGALRDAVRDAPVDILTPAVRVGIDSPFYGSFHNVGAPPVKRRTFFGSNAELDQLWVQAVENWLVTDL